jgi:hypothetical protein
MPLQAFAGARGCIYSILLQIERIRYAAEFVHPYGQLDAASDLPTAGSCAPPPLGRPQGDGSLLVQ